MRRLACSTVIVISGFVAAGCGHKSSSPTSPTATSITIQSSGAQLFLGVTEAFQAVITFSDGTQQTVSSATWNTDAPTIASVDATGHVTAKASGTVTIVVDAQGAHGTKTIRVLPNYGGKSVGNLLLSTCSSSGWSPTCSNIDDDLPHTLTFQLTQTGDAVTGTITTSFVTTTVSGTVTGGGALTFSASGVNGTKTYTETWNLLSTTAGVITGAAHVDGKDSASAAAKFTMDAQVSNAVKQ